MPSITVSDSTYLAIATIVPCGVVQEGIEPEKLRFRHSSITGDDVTNILIFGVTGMTGGSVLDATLGCAWFKVSGFTRANHGVIYEELMTKGVTVFTGDMSKPHTLGPAMKDIDTIFLITTFWESMNVEREYMQGVNVVNVALECAVKHLIYVGTDYNALTAPERCNYLEGKARVENYIVSVGIPYTLVHLGFYFENFVSVFKPHPTGKDKFAIALPMGEIALNCGSVIDFGQCISKIALRPNSYVFKTVKLATAYLTVEDIAVKFSRHFPTRIFYDPKISLAAYRQFKFEGSQEISGMFAHYQTVPEWDRSIIDDLIPSYKTFEQWLKENEKIPLEAYRQFQFKGSQEISSMFAHYQTVPEWDRSIIDDLIPSYKTFEQWLKENEKDYKIQTTKAGTPVAERKSTWNLKTIFRQGFASMTNEELMEATKQNPVNNEVIEKRKLQQYICQLCLQFKTMFSRCKFEY